MKRPDAPATLTFPQVLMGTWLVLGLALLLNIGSLEAAAQRMEPGPGRERALFIVEPIAEISRALYLHYPNAVLAWLVDKEDYPPWEEPPDDGLAQEVAEITDDDDSAGAVAEPAPPVQEGYGPFQPEPQPPFRAIDDGDPMVLWIVGDSLFQHAGADLRKELEAAGPVRATVDWRHSTGMVRPDYFDWNAQLDKTLVGDLPDAVMILLGANDNQNMEVHGGVVHAQRSQGWIDEYERRVGALMDTVASRKVRLYWVGLPVMKSTNVRKNAWIINGLIGRQAATRPYITYFSSWDMFCDDAGAYSAYGHYDDGSRFRSRGNDGVHFSVAGSRYLAEELFEILDRDWKIRDARASMEPAVDQPKAEPE